ncbi:hypothetical protein [Halegenticoccus tardaugens]|uniref:hypothetical protein n=1 Tax=Halegenticoccus tardaugens TaxID=2071624 RepID=UPI00100A61A5|nr:hypothetical protein [Halegenticoccus tardaugens]
MAIARRRKFVHAQTAWMLAAALTLALLDVLTLELFFVLSLLGFLIVVEFTAPFSVTPKWRMRLKWLILAGLVSFGYVAIRRVLSILPIEVF